MISVRRFCVLIIAFGMLFQGCCGKRLRNSQSAIRDLYISDAELAALRWRISIDEVNRRFGQGQGQPGPRVTFLSRDHPGKVLWFWLMPSNSLFSNQKVWLVHHVVLAGVDEENPVVVWPLKWKDKSPYALSKMLMDIYIEL